MNNLAYFFFRLPMALSLLGHSLVRLPRLQAFSSWMTGFMEKSYLPPPFIAGFGYIVPFAEITLGSLLLVGLFTRQSLYASLALMAMLIFGNTTIENWEAINGELIYALYLGVLLYLIPHNTFSLDSKLNNQ